MPVGMPVIRKKQAQAEKAPKKKSPGRMPLCYEPKPREKMEGKLPVPLPWNEIPESPVQHIEHAEPQDFYPERMCRSPIQMPHMTAPIKIKGTELGLSKLSKGAPPEMSPRVGDPPNKNLPKIYLGDESPKPRWLIRPVSPVFEQDTPSQPSEPQVPQLPTLGQLRWEFDAGLPEVHGQDENQLREYAYCYLRNSLSDPIVREQLREMIWNSRFAPNVAHVEDPLPVPPPPPHFKDQKPSDYANLRPPVSASAPDDYTFMYPGYERPSLAARSYKSTRMYNLPVFAVHCAEISLIQARSILAGQHWSSLIVSILVTRAKRPIPPIFPLLTRSAVPAVGQTAQRQAPAPLSKNTSPSTIVNSMTMINTTTSDQVSISGFGLP
ncbi:uncharacterized protein BDV17DRAFT_97388 [Aspergillus undulatus]|uniref:uncharacterized protein n=1 Tax=Aspergillus undulatus TaxID=1810928 RepID=UPI003CCD92A5